MRDRTIKDPPRDEVEVDDPYIGVVLNNRYHVEEKIGKGAFGYVYSATQLGNRRKVAVKLMRPESQDDPELESRFKNEGQVLCSLSNAHTVTTYDFGTTDEGIIYIVMELLEGKTLRQVIRDEAPLAWQRVLSLIMQICESLTEAHKSGIVHRDLKPANIFYEKRPSGAEVLKVLDFGTAKIIKGGAQNRSTVPDLTAVGTTMGTVAYMAPEQILGAKLSGRTDIYTLGVVTYELLTKRRPFQDVHEPPRLLARQLGGAPEPPSAVVPDAEIPERVDSLVLCMLDKERGMRFGSGEEIIQVCEDILAEDRAGGLTGPRFDVNPARAEGHASPSSDPDSADSIDDDEETIPNPALSPGHRLGQNSVQGGQPTGPAHPHVRQPYDIPSLATGTVNPIDSKRSLAPVAIAVVLALVGIVAVVAFAL